jgi:hypothetical protein
MDSKVSFTGHIDVTAGRALAISSGKLKNYVEKFLLWLGCWYKLKVYLPSRILKSIYHEDSSEFSNSA